MKSYEISSTRLSAYPFVPDLLVCLSVYQEFSPEPLLKVSWFLHEVRVSYNLKSDGAGVFCQKSCRTVFGLLKSFSSFMKNWRLGFFWFLLEGTATAGFNSRKVTNWAQNEVFQVFMENWHSEVFWFLA